MRFSATYTAPGFGGRGTMRGVSLFAHGSLRYRAWCTSIALYTDENVPSPSLSTMWYASRPSTDAVSASISSSSRSIVCVSA